MSLNKYKLNNVRAECEEMIKRIADYEKCVIDEKYHSWTHPKQSGALRRQSMELTRALSNLRSRES